MAEGVDRMGRPRLPCVSCGGPRSGFIHGEQARTRQCTPCWTKAHLKLRENLQTPGPALSKAHLIQLHRLLRRVVDALKHDVEAPEYEPYRRLRTSPLSIGASKYAHLAAIYALAQSISAALPEGEFHPQTKALEALARKATRPMEATDAPA